MLAAPPGGKDKVSPGEDVSGEHHADDDLEQEDELFESLEVGGGEHGRGDFVGGGFDGLLWNDGPLLGDFPASVVGGEAVADDAGLLLGLCLGTTLELAPVEAALDADGKGVGDL